jgi:DNA-binding transcriptional LysR family regulator
MFDLRQLRYFVAVAETLSFTRAAQALHMSQPPLSQQIQALEAGLDVRLFDRTRRRVVLTEPGRLFLVEARKLLAQAETARRVVTDAAAGFAGQLRLAYAVSVSFHPALPDALLRFRQDASRVRLGLREMYTVEQYDALANGDIDVGFLRGAPRTALQAKAFRLDVVDHERLVIALPADHPLAGKAALRMRQLASEAFLAQPRELASTLYDRLMHLCTKAGFQPEVRQIAQQLSSLLSLVAAGLGIALVPASLCAVRLSGVSFVPVDDADAWLLLAVASRAGDPSPALDAFLRTVAASKQTLGLL